MGALPDWCEPLFDAQQMRVIDSWAIEQRGIPSLDLMEHAGAGVARALEQAAPDGEVVVVCGKGNNGGDGLVAARLLRCGGRPVRVICTGAPSDLSADARTNLERLPGPESQYPDGDGQLDLNALGDARVVVDALLGTGFRGEPHGLVKGAIAAINQTPAMVLSVDVPSGVDAGTGMVGGEAVRAQVTVTFHAAKAGLWINPGKAHAGDVRVLDIGIPSDPPADADIGLIGHSVLGLLSHRRADSTKFSSGQVLVVGGSRGLTGAPRMTAQASMRAGAGYVTALVPASLQPILATAGPAEMMTRGLPESDGELHRDGVKETLETIRRGGALALGPGLGGSPAAISFARALAQQAQVAMVLDADALNAHADALETLATRTAPTVLTPHAGELGRLLAVDPREIERERLRHARDAARRSGAVVVLKGDDTLIANPSGLVAVSPGGAPGLATAGSGDVLTGVIAALLAQSLDGFNAACAGVWIHLQAGRQAARAQGGPDSVIASDVIEALAPVRNIGERRVSIRRVCAAVDLAAIERNCLRLRSQLAEGVALCAVVKADGYGHGAEQSARAALAAGAGWLAVAGSREALTLREAGLKEVPILVMGALSDVELAEALAADADVVVWHERFVERVARAGGGRVHVKLDTGMGRLGTRDPLTACRAAAAAAETAGVRLVGAMTHFATADDPGDDFLEHQLERFRQWVAQIKADHPDVLVHAANSAATLRDKSTHFDVVRCGLAIYGMDPFGENPLARGLEPALELRSYVAEVKHCAAGESTGYGRRFVATRDTYLGVLPVGYGDGFRRGLSDNAEVLIDGCRHPLVGTVSMDNIAVDLGPDPQALALDGRPAVLIGTSGEQRITTEELARRLDTINYEITCGLTARVPRVYHNDPGDAAGTP